MIKSFSFLFSLVVVISTSFQALGQSMPEILLEDPYLLDYFNPKDIIANKIKRIKIETGIKIPGKKIATSQPTRIYRFNDDGLPTTKLVLTTLFGTYQDSVLHTFYYEDKKLAREDVLSKSGQVLKYYNYSGNNLLEEKTFRREGEDQRYAQERLITYVPSSTKPNQQITKIIDNDILVLLKYYYFDGNKRLEELQEVKPLTGKKISTSWDYQGNRISSQKVDEYGLITAYNYTYNSNNQVIKVEKTHREKPLELVEYFYYNNLLESTLKANVENSELEITNFTYYFR